MTKESFSKMMENKEKVKEENLSIEALVNVLTPFIFGIAVLGASALYHSYLTEPAGRRVAEVNYKLEMKDKEERQRSYDNYKKREAEYNDSVQIYYSKTNSRKGYFFGYNGFPICIDSSKDYTYSPDTN